MSDDLTDVKRYCPGTAAQEMVLPKRAFSPEYSGYNAGRMGSIRDHSDFKEGEIWKWELDSLKMTTVLRNERTCRFRQWK